MKSLRVGIAIACGALAGAGCGCAPEAQGAAIAELTQLESARDPELIGAAGQGAEEPEGPEAPEHPPTDGTIIGLDGDDLTGLVSLAAGSAWSGEISLFCCRDGSYDVYAYEGGRCSDSETWRIEDSTRVAQLSCSNDLGSADYARDPSEAGTTAFVVYDASGTALGCADVAAE